MNKNFLVTGASGFIASHIADYLTKKNFKVTLFDKRKSPYKKKNQKMIIGNLNNYRDIIKATKKQNTILHFAASADLTESNEKPFETIENNVFGTLNLIRSCVKNKVKKIFYASSIYAISEQGGIYSTSKLSSEMIIEQLCKKFNIKFVILRFGTVYGERANKFNTVKNFVDNAKKYKKIFRNTQGNEIRSYINVHDVTKIIYILNKKKHENAYFNIFGNRKIIVKKLLGLIKKKIPGTKIFYSKKDYRKYNYKTNPFTYKLRKGKIIKLKKYIDLETGLDKLIF